MIKAFDAQEADEMQLPDPRRKLWQDASFEVERVRGRAGVPPNDPTRCLRGSRVANAVHEQCLRHQANMFEVRAQRQD